MIVEKVYYVANSKDIERAMKLLSKPLFALCVERECLEMDYSKITVTCLESQVEGIEHILWDII